MNREEIIRVAREQGLPETETEGVFRVNSDDLGRMLATEREACARECEIEASVNVVNASEQYQEGRSMGATVCYHAIRARSNQ